MLKKASKAKTAKQLKKPEKKLKEPPIKSVSDVNNPRSTVLYGRSGTGKTTLASTWPKPILFLDINDQGTDSISDVEDCDVLEVETWDDLEEYYWWLSKNSDRYKTVVIDTVTGLQDLAIKRVLNAKKKDSSKAGDWGSMTQREWGDVGQAMKHWLVNFRDLPMEVVFLAQDRVFNTNNEEDSDVVALAPEVGPRLMPSVVSTLNAAVNIIGNTFVRVKRILKEDKKRKGKKKEVEKLVYCLRIGPNPVYITKLRKPKSVEVPTLIEDPTYEDIQDVIKGR